MSPDSPLCVLAAAGSGKTTVLARRVARRILDGSARAEHTLVVTFTRKASRELRQRLARLGVPGGMSAGTFHAMAFAQLRRHWADRGVRPPVVVDDPARLVRAVARLRHLGQALAGRGGARGAPLGPGEHGAGPTTTPRPRSPPSRDTPVGVSRDDIAEVYAAYGGREGSAQPARP